MKDKFPGYYQMPKGDFDRMWKEGIFVFDANFLLDLFRYSDETAKSLLNTLNKIKDRIFFLELVESLLCGKHGVRQGMGSGNGNKVLRTDFLIKNPHGAKTPSSFSECPLSCSGQGQPAAEYVLDAQDIRQVEVRPKSEVVFFMICRSRRLWPK